MSQLGVVYRRGTHISQQAGYDPVVMGDVISYTNEVTQLCKYSPDLIVNLDETNIAYDMNCVSTLEGRGSKSVNILTTGNSNRATIILAVTMSGEKLPQ